VAPTHETAVDLGPAELAAWRGMLRAHASLLHDMDAELTATTAWHCGLTRSFSTSRMLPGAACA